MSSLNAQRKTEGFRHREPASNHIHFGASFSIRNMQADDLLPDKYTDSR